MSERFDIIVVGGGIVGLTAAIAMRQRDFSVAVIDAGAMTMNMAHPDSRVYAINQASQSLLQTLGVWQQLDKSRVSPYSHMHVWDAANGACLDFDARMMGTDKLGAIIEESVIKHALLQQASAEGVVFFPHHRVSAVETTVDEVQVLSDTKVWHASLLMVADGAMSATRQLLDVAVTSWPYHQHAIVATVETELSHQQTAYQVFNADGPLAFLPLSKAHQCSIVWSTTPTHAQTLMALSEDDFNQQLTQAFAAKLGASRLLGTRHLFPLHMRHTRQYSGRRWLLMGDAAHSIHPLAGLGLNVGLADVSAWLANLDASNSPAWSNKVLGAYQRQRKSAVWKIIALMEGLKTLFINPTFPVTTLRGLGLRACNNLPALKRFFIEQAAGQDAKQ